MNKVSQLFFCLFFLLPPIACLKAAQVMDEAELIQTFTQPIQIEKKDGRIFTGHPESITPNEITLTTQVGEGEVVYVFRREEVARLSLPWEESLVLARDLAEERKLEDSLSLFRQLFLKQKPYLPFLGEKAVRPFLPFINALLENKAWEESIKVATHLLPFAREPATQEQLREAILLSHYYLQRYEKTLQLIKEWGAKEPLYPENALTWWLRAQTSLDQGDAETALWTSLHPIVFSSQFPLPWLEHCYAVAIAANHHLGEKKKADLLLQEMQERQLSWPEIPGLENIKVLYETSPLN